MNDIFTWVCRAEERVGLEPSLVAAGELKEEIEPVYEEPPAP